MTTGQTCTNGKCEMRFIFNCARLFSVLSITPAAINSHLPTPLTAVKLKKFKTGKSSYGPLLFRTTLSDQPHIEYIHVIHKATDRVKRNLKRSCLVFKGVAPSLRPVNCGSTVQRINVYHRDVDQVPAHWKRRLSWFST